ncbi:DUF2513 domain-containing protein [Enterococcus cecorum]|uniref:DUF2513 domain-containing protein n=1 Tax=Enterococcus cecorum TaxID=44008 RepID=UPI001FABCA56|nr:DUF2513 domain-containing protein [Enterococcus cecorum]MCJ0597768.1 DUF2513 domain-containing protein [Enterococcus cecorum]
MHLKHDCVRDILIFIEDLPFNHQAMNDEIFSSERLSKYSKDEIIYAIERIGNDDAQLINGYVMYASNEPYIVCVKSLTFDGHQYLNNIRDPKVWSETKKATSKIASVSLDIMSSVASNVIIKMLGLN